MTKKSKEKLVRDAAPELLEALTTLVDTHNEQLKINHSKPVNPEAYIYGFELAEKAIKKATKP